MLMNRAAAQSHAHTFGASLTAMLTLAGSWLTAKLGSSRFSGSGLRSVKSDQFNSVKSWVSRNGWLPQVLSAAALTAIFFLLAALASYLRLQPSSRSPSRR